MAWESDDIESVPDAIPIPSFAAVRALEKPTPILLDLKITDYFADMDIWILQLL